MSEPSLRDELSRAFHEAEGAERARRGTVSKADIRSFYTGRIAGAKSWDELRGVTLVELYGHLAGGGKLRASFKRVEGALRRALHDLNRRLQARPPVRWFGLRTNGSLWVKVPPGAELDSPFYVVGPRGVPPSRVSEGPAPPYGDTVRLSGVVEGGKVQLPSSITLRDGAEVDVVASRRDVVAEEPWAPRYLPPGELLNWIGVVSYGGDALEDSERWED